MNIIEAVLDPVIIGDTLSVAQETGLRALYGLDLNDAQLEIFRLATGLEFYSPREVREATYICGRRSGKSSRLGSNIALFEGCFRDHELDLGERGHVVVISPTKKQSGIVFEYMLSRLENSPTLRGMIDGEPRRDEVDLVNGITLSVWPCNYRSVRGISIVCCIADEVAFWTDDASGANPAAEVLAAVRPGMATFPKAKLVKISSPFAKAGVVWEDWKSRATRPEMLVWKLGTRQMNSSLDSQFLIDEEQRDPESFQREYGAEFYESASTFLSVDAIENCIRCDRFELPPQNGLFYVAALDAAFRSDNFAFGIVHSAGEKVFQDFGRSWCGSRSKPISLAAVLEEICETLRRYGISRIHGDQFCSEPIRQALAGRGVEFLQSTTLGARATQVWNSLRTLIASAKIELLDDPATISELKRLELVVTAGGNSRVEASAGHDDRAVALALASHIAVAQPRREPWSEFLRFSAPDGHHSESWQRIV